MREYFPCNCGTPSHLLMTNADDEWGFMMQPILNHYRNFWERLIFGIRYMFGFKSDYGDFDSIHLDEDAARRLRKLLDEFLLPLEKEESEARKEKMRKGIQDYAEQYAEDRKNSSCPRCVPDDYGHETWCGVPAMEYIDELKARSEVLELLFMEESA